jgi:hypothetical protein
MRPPSCSLPFASERAQHAGSALLGGGMGIIGLLVVIILVILLLRLL